MAEIIEIPKTPMSRTEQYLTKIVKELSGSKEDVEIPKAALSRVEYYLQAIVNLLAENSINLDDYVKTTDIASQENAGLIQADDPKQSGLTIGEDGKIAIYHPDASDLESVSDSHTALTLDRVQPVMSYYGLTNKDTLKNDYVKDAQVPTVMNGYGLESKTFIQDNYVKHIMVGESGNINNTWYKLYELTSNKNVSSYMCNLTFMVTGGVGYAYSMPTFICHVNSRNANYLTITCINNCDNHNNTVFGYVEKDNVVEIWMGVTMTYSAGINVITLDSRKSSNCQITINYDSTKFTTRPISLKEVQIKDSITSDYGITDKKWCHEIKKKTSNNVTTDGNGTILPAVSEIVLAAYASTKISERSVCLIPIYGSGGTYTSFLAIDYVTGEKLKKTLIGDVTFYYITDTTTAEQTNPSSPESEEPSMEPQSQHVPFHTEVETTETVDPLETEDIQDGEIDG